MNRMIAVAVLLLMQAMAWQPLFAEDGVVEVKLGETIKRAWNDVKADDYAYGPKQDFQADTGETHVYLPYGNSPKLYAKAVGTLTDAGKGGLAKYHTADGNTSADLVYKLHFDKPVAAFRFYVSWTELGLQDGAVAGVEYSSDGQTWKTLKETNKSGIVNEFVSAKQKIEGLNTDTLYIRFYSRDPANPTAANGSGRWMQFWMSGDPNWGDASSTFFARQIQIWVTPAAGNASAPTGRTAINPLAAAPLIASVIAQAADPDTRENNSPWGFSSSAEWFGQYPKFNPMMSKIGVSWLRGFGEWNSIEPKRGEFRWDGIDKLVANARENNIHLIATFAYLTTWNSADGGTRKFPMKDPEAYREYAHAAMDRYQKDILYWEIGNELNGSFGPGCTPKLYADMAVMAYEEAKKIGQNQKVGLSVANFDVGYLDAAIKAGAADHFDFICVHPYENVGTLAEGGEMGFLSLTGNLRDMLKANKQTQDVQLWATEFGYQAPVKPDAVKDALQADILTKSHVLFLVQGFDRLTWFEARGPAYGHGTDHGIIREDWSIRPAYTAYGTMISMLGQVPKYVGWINVAEGGFGFVFDGPKGPLMVAWAPPAKELKAMFDGDVTVADQYGKQSPLAAGGELKLSTTPVYVLGIPATVVDQAKANLGKPYPWGGNYADAKQVVCTLGAVNNNDGLTQRNPKTTAVVNDLTSTCRRLDFAHGGEGHYAYFRVDPQFVPYGTDALTITIVAKRIDGKNAGMNLSYESKTGYHNAPGWWTIPEGDGWQENSWTVTDANFVGQWGWNFRFDAISSPNEFMIKEVRVTKAK